MGRPPLPKEKQRVAVSVSVAPATLTRWESDASACGLPLGRYLEMVTVNNPPTFAGRTSRTRTGTKPTK